MTLFQSQFESLLKSWDHEPEDLVSLRQKAFNQFTNLGLPTRKWEEWQFTNFGEIGKNDFQLSSPEALPKKSKYPIPDPVVDYSLIFINGHYQPQLTRIPDGVSVKTLLEAYKSQPSHFNHARGANPFLALNTAMMNSGLWVEISKNIQVDSPIRFLFITTDISSPFMNHPRIILRIHKGASATFLEHYFGDSPQSSLTNVVQDIQIDEGAALNHVRIQEEGPSAIHVAATTYNLKRNASLKAHAISTGSKLQRSNIRLTFQEEGSEANLWGLSLSKNNQHQDTHVVMDHCGPNCRSGQYFKNILTDKSQGVFNGRVVVRKDAQKTDANQSNKNILLSTQALMHSNPQLEIDADDVRCSHGSTTGQIDKEALFYLRSRGIDLETARGLIVNGFASEILKEIQHNPIKDYLDSQLASWLESLKIKGVNA